MVKIPDYRAFRAIAIGARLSSAPEHLCRTVCRGGLRVLLLQPELVQGSQEQRKDHRAATGRRLRRQLFGYPIAIWRGRSGSSVISGSRDRSLQQAERRQFRFSPSLGRHAGTGNIDAADGRPNGGDPRGLRDDAKPKTRVRVDRRRRRTDIPNGLSDHRAGTELRELP